jgi:hypothetical protein
MKRLYGPDSSADGVTLDQRQKVDLAWANPDSSTDGDFLAGNQTWGGSIGVR